MSKVTDKKRNRKNQGNNLNTSISETVGFSKIIDFFRNERLHFVVGAILLAVSVCMTWSFVSFFSTGAFDQSIIENIREGDLSNQGMKFQNAIGSLGAWMSFFFMNKCFGIAAFAQGGLANDAAIDSLAEAPTEEAAGAETTTEG